MWQKLKFLTLIHIEIDVHRRKRSVALPTLLEKGFDYLWIKTIYPDLNSWWRILFRKWFCKLFDRKISDEKTKIIYDKVDKLLDTLSPKYIKITQEGIHKYIKLTYEGERFIRPVGFFTELLKEYSVWLPIIVAIPLGWILREIYNFLFK